MTTIRAYWILAVTNVVCGVSLAGGAIFATGRVALGDGGNRPLVAASLLAVIAIISGSLIRGATFHLRRPTRKSAVTVAVNSAVIIWFLCSRLFKMAGLGEAIGPANHVIAAAAAYLCYRYLLAPSAAPSSLGPRG